MDFKKTGGVLAGIALVGFAVFVGYSSFKPKYKGTSTIEKGLKVWLKCSDPKCGNEFQMEKRAYWDKVIAERGPVSTQEVFFECPKCHKKTSYLADKCAKCGLVFKPNPGIDDVPDRCPKCKFSSMESGSPK